MTKPIFSPTFWSERLRNARERHHAVYICTRARWDAIAEKHRTILARHIRPGDAILEAGCAWGRLVDLLPPGDFEYVGVDLCPEFIDLARREYPQRHYEFRVADLRDLSDVLDERRGQKFDWCAMISLRGMVLREAGAAEWAKIERELQRVARRLLVLEYDEHAEGEVIGDER